MADLRARIRALERRSPFPEVAPQADARPWTLGAPEIDRRAGGLDAAGMHEVKPQSCTAGAAAGNWAAALGFALRLAVRRLQALGASSGAPREVLWCWPSVFARELGLPCGQGLAFLGLEPASCLLVETARAADALWALEEGLKSASLALVVGILHEVELTPARRLSLAAAGHRTPCLLITDPRAPAAGSTATRWRVGAQRSAVHPYDARAPGAARYAVSLERCRHGPPLLQALSLGLEWSDETYRFRVAAPLAHRALEPGRAGRGAG